jgi:hypothetical protein
MHHVLRHLVLGAAGLALVAGTAQARDTVLFIPLEAVLAMPEAQSKLDGSVKFHLKGDPKAPKKTQSLGSANARHKTNGVGKSDEFGCKWVILSALIDLQKDARRAGANAVVDIESYTNSTVHQNAETVECHAGNIIIGASLRGLLVKKP